jgi:hypothetical protein
MRDGTLICCLMGTAILGCGKHSGTPEVRGLPAEESPSEDLATSPDELVFPHGSAARADFGSGPDVRLDAITLTAPAAWSRTKPSSSFYVAEFALPRVDKDAADGRVMVSVGSGSVEMNLDVFKGEFDTASEYAKQDKKEVAGFPVTFVDVSGAYTRPHGPSAPATPLADYRMIVAAIPVGDQLHFIKAVGPQQTIAAHAEAIHAFVGSVQRRGAAAEPSGAAAGATTDVRVKPLTLTAPTTWKRTKPRSSLVEAEFALPRVDPDTADGRLTVSVVGGSIQENVDRWKGQFAGTIESPKQEETEVGDLKTTLVDFTGTFGEQAAMSGPVVKRPDYRMIAAIVPIGDQLYVIKAIGPKQTMAAHVEAIRSFVRSMRRDG